MKHLIKRVRKFLAPSPEMDVKYLQEKVKRLERDLTMFDYNWYEMHLEKGTDMTTLDMLKGQAEFQIVNHLELLCQARLHRLRKRILIFMCSMLTILLILLITGYVK